MSLSIITFAHLSDTINCSSWYKIVEARHLRPIIAFMHKKFLACSHFLPFHLEPGDFFPPWTRWFFSPWTRWCLSWRGCAPCCSSSCRSPSPSPLQPPSANIWFGGFIFFQSTVSNCFVCLFVFVLAFLFVIVSFRAQICISYTNSSFFAQLCSGQSLGQGNTNPSLCLYFVRHFVNTPL